MSEENKLLAELSDAPSNGDIVFGDQIIFDERWWWVSFADSDKPSGQQFLGVAIVRAHEPLIAGTAWSHGCNPGGGMYYTAIPDEYGDPPEEWQNKLITSKDRINELTEAWIGGECKTLGELEDEGCDV